MKKFLLIRTVVLSTSLFALTPSFSQSSATGKIASLDYSKRPAVASGGSSESADRVAVMKMRDENVRMYNDFSSSFKNATNIRVSAEKKETHISCYVDGVLHKINYTNKGRWSGTIRYFEVGNLSQDIRNIVIDAYPRYSLFGFVAQVIVPGKTAYLVMIERQDSWKRIRVMDGAVETFEEYNKP